MASRTVYNCDICGAEYQLPDGETVRKICKFKNKDVYLATAAMALDICSNCSKALNETLLTLKENNLGCDITVDMEED